MAGAHCGSATCLLKKLLTAKQSLSLCFSVAEIAVVIRLRLGETRKGRKMQTSLHILLVQSEFVQSAEIQSFPGQVLARHGRNTSAQPYRGMHMYASIHE